MPPSTNYFFRTWIKYNSTIKLRSDAAVVHIPYEGISNCALLTDSDKKTIESLLTICNEKIPTIIDDTAAGITAESGIHGANISFIAIHRLIVAVQAAKYSTLISRKMIATNIQYRNLFSSFNIEWNIFG